MDNMDDPETTAKISDSAYSNSCSNSQSRRSHSSKSTHSGSHSSGSSGYGGKPSTSGSSNTLNQPPKKDKDSKKKKQSQTETKVTEKSPNDDTLRPPEPAPVFAVPQEEPINVVEPTLAIALPEELVGKMDITPTLVNAEEASLSLQPTNTTETYVISCPVSASVEGFSCVISMHDGVVMYTSPSVTATLGYPSDVWIGRSFIDFVHPRDHKTFASLITNGLAVPKIENGTNDGKGLSSISGSTMVCRVRRYRSLNVGFGIKDVVMTFMPFLLKFSFKNFDDEDGKVIYLVIQATPFHSAYETPNEIVKKAVPFTIRHDANGILEYIDPESVPYLGYLPQDVQYKDAIRFYHPDDLPYLIQLYENIVKEGNVSRSKPYRLMAQNGDFIKLETEWSSVINPWSMKLEFIIGTHHIIEGPTNPDVFQSPGANKTTVRTSEAEKFKLEALRDCIMRVMNEVRKKPTEAAKQIMGKRCQELAHFMETLIEEPNKNEEELKLDIQEIQDRDLSYYERDTVMLGGISPHHDSDSKSSVETPLSYNQVNYNENLQRFFESQTHLCHENDNTIPGDVLGPQYDTKVLQPHPPTQIFSLGNSMSPMAQNSGDMEISSNSSSAVVMFESSPSRLIGDYQHVRLTESLLHKHNMEMEKELVKLHRETRFSKVEREKTSNETRKKKKEHLARCKASFYPTTAGISIVNQEACGGMSNTFGDLQKEPHGVKRSLKLQDQEITRKLHCPSRRRRPSLTSPVQFAIPAPVTTGGNQWQTNSYMYGVGMPQPMPMITPTISVLPGMPGTSQMSNMSGTSRQPVVPGTSQMSNMPGTSRQPVVPGTSGMSAMPGTSVMAAMSGTSVMAAMPGTSVMAAMPGLPGVPGLAGMYPLYYAAQQGVLPSDSKPQYPTTSDVHQFTPPGAPYVMQNHGLHMYGQQYAYSPMNGHMYPMAQTRMHHSMQYPESLSPLGLPINNYEQNANTRQSQSSSHEEKSKNTSDENTDRTDGESSYSSFYSSFFKTDSGSAGESNELKKKKSNGIKNRSSSEEIGSLLKRNTDKKLARRKMEAPWNEQVNVTSELIYRYQIVTQPLKEVLEADKQKMATMEQPALVNEQLGQLYLDLQLQGVAARLTLEEGITSSSSSGEETSAIKNKFQDKRKREYSKLVIIHEEDAPLPPDGHDPLIPEGPPDEDITPIGFT